MSFEVENDMDGEIGDIGTRPSKFQNRKKSLADLLTGGYNLSGSSFQVKGPGQIAIFQLNNPKRISQPSPHP